MQSTDGTMNQDLAAMLQRMQQLEAENQALNQRIKEQETIVKQPVAQSVEREPSVALPEKFDGKRDNLRTFLNQLELVFLINPSRYPNDSVKVATAATLLTGMAAAWFNPIVENQNENIKILRNWATFKTLLKNTFSAVDPSVKAGNEIGSLKQGNGTVTMYVARFTQLAADLQWNESALMHAFRSGLADDVKDVMIAHDPPNTLNDLVTLACRVDARLCERKLERTVPGRRTQFNPPVSSSLPPAPAQEQTPMEIDAVRRGPLSPEERQRRYTNRLCIICGEAGHYKFDCPSRRKTHPGNRTQPPSGNGKGQ